MRKQEIEEAYAQLVAEVEKMRMYDGRGKGVDVYVCENCGCKMYTRYKDKGVTPFAMACRECGSVSSHRETITEATASWLNVTVRNWVRPSLEQLLKLSPWTIDHVLNGGLVLEDQLESKKLLNMVKQNIIEIDGQKYRRLYYNTCCRCALRSEVTGKPCPIEDCEDGIYYKEVKEE